MKKRENRQSQGYEMPRSKITARSIRVQRQEGAEDNVLPISSAPRLTSALETSDFDLLQSMRADILSGRLEPGQRIKFDELQSRYRASIGLLREALRHLLSQGLVQLEANRGFTVAPVSVADFLDITELRIKFESMALTDAIRHGDDAWEAEIVTALHLLLKLTEPGAQSTKSPDWPARHRRFHQSLVAGSRSPWLLHFRSVLFDQAERYRSLGRKYRKSPRDIASEHRQFAEAVLARDSALACRLGDQHIRSTVENVTTNVPGLAKAAGRPSQPRAGAST